ncbi:MAG: hypothetical protein KY453_05020 [Gemmatimonadetes bacterium]|nr:hypothetical protein [Gemmatimonadota bacterium]
MFWQLIFVLILLIPILSIILDSQVGRALAQRLERRGIGTPDDLVADRVAYLESEVDRLASEVSRLDEESQFLHKLLEGRPPERASLPEGDGNA